MSIHTLIWEIFDSRGDYQSAATHLRANQVVENGMHLLLRATEAVDQFQETEFPSTLEPAERCRNYDLWRQRAVATMAWCLVRLVIESCLGRAGFPCNGTRARYHYFLAQMLESCDGISAAAAEYGKALQYCIERAQERIAKGRGRGAEENPARFCHLLFGKVEAEAGFTRV